MICLYVTLCEHLLEKINLGKTSRDEKLECKRKAEKSCHYLKQPSTDTEVSNLKVDFDRHSCVNKSMVRSIDELEQGNEGSY